MVECEFTFSVAVISKTIDVTFKSIPIKKIILIAQDWRQGEVALEAGLISILDSSGRGTPSVGSM